MASTPSHAPAVKAALLTRLRALYASDPSIQVFYSDPGAANGNLFNLVHLGAISATQAFATMGPRRTRDETLAIEVVFWASGGGDVSAQQTYTEKVYARAALLDNDLGADPRLGIGDASIYQLVPVSAVLEETDADFMAMGRFARLTVGLQLTGRLN